MKQYSVLVIIILIALYACGQDEEKKLTLHGAEAYTFKLEQVWEINALVHAKGFTQKENNGEYNVNLAYVVDLLTPTNEKISEIDYGLVEKSSGEEFSDIQIDSQIEIDTAFAPGDYKLIFLVIDKYSDMEAETEITAKLTEE